jgi:hypothetical protein
MTAPALPHSMDAFAALFVLVRDRNAIGTATWNADLLTQPIGRRQSIVRLII